MRTPHNTDDRFAAFQRGDRAAFEFYYNLYADRIHYFLQERTGEWAAATDRTQETFIILYKDKQKLKNEEHIKPFLYTVAKNLAWKYLEEKGRLKEFKEELDAIGDTNVTILEVREAEQTKGEILMALKMSRQGLPERKRKIIELFYFDGKSTNEIAKLLGIEPQTVRNHLSQSIRLLRKGLDGRWEEINLFFS